MKDIHAIKDTKLKECVLSFIEIDKQQCHPKLIYSEYVNILVPVVCDISFDEFDAAFVSSYLEQNAVTKVIIRFIIYMCEEHLTKTNSLQMIIPYKEFFQGRAFTRLKKFFSSPVIERCYHEQIHLSEDELDVALSVGGINFTDINIKNCICDFLYNAVTTDKKSIYAYKHRLQTIFIDFFAPINAENITRELVYQHLLNSKNVNHKIYCINKIIAYMCKSGLMIDDDMRYICEIKEYMSTVSTDDYLSMLKADYPRCYFATTTTISHHLWYIPVDSEELFEVLKDYYKDINPCSEYICFAKHFKESINGLNIRTIEDLSIYTMQHQLYYFKNNYDIKNILTTVIGFYFLIANKYYPDIFAKDGFDARLLQRLGFSSLVVKGFDLIKYNPCDDVPHSDKWILCFSSDDDSNMSLCSGNIRPVDFSKINNPTYRYWCKYYFWKNSNTSIYSRIKALHVVGTFFNFIDDIKHGKRLSLYTKPTNNTEISVSEVLAWKNYINSTYTNNRTICTHIYQPRTILQFVNNSKLTNVPSGVFYYLTTFTDSSRNDAKAIPDEHLKLLGDYMKQNAETNPIYALYHLAFYLALETEMRSSQLFSLKIDCIHETAKKNEYVIISKTKTSANEEIEQPITIYTKRHIEEIITITNRYRESCLPDMANYLFVMPAMIKGTSKLMTSSSFNSYLRTCCSELNLPIYNYQNLRDTHMTKAEEYVIRKGLSEIEQNVLSGHSSATTDRKHYIDTNIKELLESVHGVIIGDVNIDGKIKETLPTDIASDENSVSNKCGYCGCKNCSDYSFLDCLMCKDFVTTIDRLPYFEEQIKILDVKIQAATIPHDKEDLVNIKRLHLGFIQKILNIKAQKGDALNDSK